MSPNVRRIQSDAARRQQFERIAATLPWPEKASRFSVRLSKAVIFGLLPLCAVVWVVYK
jgi:hypothetical protein